MGIPPDRIHRLFKPFSQADSSTTREYGDSGLGLAISEDWQNSSTGVLNSTTHLPQVPPSA
ncbi:MAG: hypothetical protein J6386_12040 [Candidatus Synoicihabitans palmerolidicus]|nr:hypothetical protein [Candidatus Synoicihabitans palmerolidicus]